MSRTDGRPLPRLKRAMVDAVGPTSNRPLAGVRVIETAGVAQLAPAPRFSRLPPAVRRPPSAHPAAVLADRGIDRAEIERHAGADAISHDKEATWTSTTTSTTR
jgi:hypothetical protein